MFIGLVIGAIVAVILLAVLSFCKAAGEADDHLEGYQVVSPCYIPPEPTPEPDTLHPQDPLFTADITDDEIYMAAQTVWGEARGIQSEMEQAAIVWCILNRYDRDGRFGGTLEEVIAAPGQFNYDESFPTVDDYERDITELVRDVIGRWEQEKNGQKDVGRVLPSDYLWFGGDGAHNHFRNSYESFDNIWDWSLPDPYEEMVVN